MSNNRSDAPGKAEQQYDVAVVFVHGIGEQLRGETLQAGVRCLSLDSLTSGPTPHEDVGGCSAEVLLLTLENGRETHVLCVDGWWNDVVHEHPDRPRSWAVWSWTVLIAPFVLFQSGILSMVGAWIRLDVDNSSSVLSARDWRWRLGAIQSMLWRAVIAPPFFLLIAALGTCALALETAGGRARGGQSRVANISQSVMPGHSPRRTSGSTCFAICRTLCKRRRAMLDAS